MYLSNFKIDKEVTKCQAIEEETIKIAKKKDQGHETQHQTMDKEDQLVVLEKEDHKQVEVAVIVVEKDQYQVVQDQVIEKVTIQDQATQDQKKEKERKAKKQIKTNFQIGIQN